MAARSFGGRGRGRVLAIALACAVGGFSPAALAEMQATPHEKLKTFTLRLSAEPETLDWNRAHTPIETYLLMNLMEGLVSFKTAESDSAPGRLEVVPALAESWKLSADRRTYTFKLRAGVQWSDGIPLRAADFVYSWRRLLTPATAASYAYLLYDIEGAQEFGGGKLKDFSRVGIRALDDRTLEVRLAHPVAHWIQIPTFWVTFPLRQDVVERAGAAWHTPGRMVTLGPYLYSEHEIDSKIVLKPNPLYYGKRGNVERVEGLIVRDDSTAVTLYESGRLDFLTDLSTLDLARLQSHPELRSFPYLKTGYLAFAVKRPEIRDAHLRRAIALGIDKSRIGEVLHGRQTPATTFVPPGMVGYSAKVGLPFDPAWARRELALAGVAPGSAVKLAVLSNNLDKTLSLSQFLQQEIKKNLGLQLTLEPFDHKTFRSRLLLHSFPLYINSWSADYPDPDNFLSIFLSDAGNNLAQWSHPRFDEGVLRARQAPAGAARERSYLELQKMLLEEDPAMIPLYYEPNLALVRKRVHGLELNPLNYLLLKRIDLVQE